MIFITVGTHEQPFNRLLKEIDELKKNNIIHDQVIVQSGYSSYIPKYCMAKRFFSLTKMADLIDKARIVVTHGGPASFIQVLQAGKIPIVVPRQEKYHEHINDHQVDFVKLIEKDKNNIIPIYNIKDLKNAIVDYDKYILNKNSIVNNNVQFNKRFTTIVNELFE